MKTADVVDYSVRLKELQRRLGVHLRNTALLEAALTHPSFWGEVPMSEPERLSLSYERLEFLGDSVIGITVCTYLYKTFPSYDQGKMSKLKSYLVSSEVLSRAAQRLGLDDYIRLGKGVGSEPNKVKPSFMVDCLESLVGVVFLEKPYAFTSRFVLRILNDEIKSVTSPEKVEDVKTMLQELVQKLHKEIPKYRLVSESGPEHKKVFTMKVLIKGKEYGNGTGYTKKDAERAAALKALKKIRKKKMKQPASE
ncbi:MAG: ribonuclease III [bacterium]